MVTVVVVLICSLSFAVAQPISLVQKPLWPGFRRGAAGGLAISNQYAFVGASQGGLMVFDVGTPSLPRLVTQLRDIGWDATRCRSYDFARQTEPSPWVP